MSHLFLSSILLAIIIIHVDCYSYRSLRRIKRITDNDCTDSAGKVPYVVSIYGKEKGYNHFICSGALLHPSFVITAAHCVTNKSAELSVHGSTSNDTRYVIKTHTPIEWGKKFAELNVAVLKLDQPFLPDISSVQPIELCDNTLEPGDLLEISGWGRQKDHSAYMPWRKCAKRYFGIGPITRYMFCGQPEVSSDVCLRDAGGPVVHNGKLCGIVLWSGGWINVNYPEIYFNLRSVRGFITYALGEI